MKKRTVACAFISLVALVGSANADMVNWTTGGAQLVQMGNWGYPQYPYDIVTLYASSGSLNLSGTPVDVLVNPLTFEVGVNSTKSWIDSDVLTRDITVNGITKSLSLSNPIDVAISSSDTLHVYEGPAVTFGDIIVTPLGWTAGLVNGGGTKTSSVYARFELDPPAAAAVVPVPGAVLLGLLGLSAAGLRLRRFA